eukprot:CAMPEP_0206011320 /NCGR_PEP_ID=MMETSP1464-20131121/13047_1 /ASSEMBLY_ACC=CAM_ASM_001124 /TAXON_ID=119497 /ORGANISM="Exanthemachrysis gayraliae, Strain RCC1523" /LENGTH=57 /DNA_ID=CAMNT_0053384977 /DNA_START=163 /DNA_END=334 /DNA_ORIENTATION=-
MAWERTPGFQSSQAAIHASEGGSDAAEHTYSGPDDGSGRSGSCTQPPPPRRTAGHGG